MAMPREQHDYEVFSSTASQMAILGVALVAIMIVVWLY
jgi:hypothetical protein